MTEEERRRYPRYRSNYEIHLFPLSDADTDFRDIAVLRDISDGGLSFITKSPDLFYVDQQLNFEVRHSNHHSRLEGSATVKWLNSFDHPEKQAYVGVELGEIVESGPYRSE